MSVENSLYGYSDWQPLPSPNTTPHSEKFTVLPPSSPVPSHASPDRFWTPVLHSNAPASMASSSQRRSTLKRNSAGHQLSHDVFESPTRARPHHDADAAAPAFPSGSFLEKFEAAQIDSLAASHMRTPPPPKEASARKKSQPQSQIRWQTPSTVASRRPSNPNDTWAKRFDSHSAADSSPLNFHTPSQFPAADFSSFDPSSAQPATAPAYTSDLFWDPNTPFHASFSPAPTLYDDPFVTAPQSMPMPNFCATSTASEQPPLPSSSTSMSGFPSSQGVDPSMLFAAQPAPPPLARSQSFHHGTSNRTGPASGAAARPAVAAKTMRQPRSRLVDAGSVQRTFGDAARADAATAAQRSNRNSQETNELSHAAHIPRRSSPLKRQHSALESRYRKSVQLVVDRTGTAKTVIRMVPIEGADGPLDDSNGDVDMSDRPPSRQDNAKDALKEAIVGRRRARHSGFF